MTDKNQVTPLDAPASDEGVVTWLNGYAEEHPFLLAFADVLQKKLMTKQHDEA